MRFEAKHSFFKKVVHDSHNWKNVLLTLSAKHQQMMAYHLDSGNLFKPKLYVENVKVVRVSELDPSLQCQIQKKYPHQDTVSLSKKNSPAWDILWRGHDFICWAAQWPPRIPQDCEYSC